VNGSAKLIDVNEITPGSNYVFIDENGLCDWEPRYELSITQCHVDLTWFPFDEQVCELAFESWTLDSSTLNVLLDNQTFDMHSFMSPESWYLTGTSTNMQTYQ